jgi:Protein of unknown function (DUF2849)
VARAPKSIQVLTANRLIDGRVVFWTDARGWEADVNTAKVFPDPAAAETDLMLAQADVVARKIVDPYAIAVTAEAGLVTPTLLRERIRATGPTI